MVFSSLPFLFVFFPITFLLYFIVPKKAKNILLLITSLIFYAWGEPIYVFLMIFTCLIGYYTALWMEKYPKHNKKILIGTIIFDLAILGFFKYANFLIDNINGIFNLSINALELSLPIGISFYTFQIMSYTIDVFKKEVKAEKNFFYFTTYVSLFPQLIAGPIVRYQTISDELHNREVTLEKFSQGFTRFVIGLGKKVLLANNIGALFNSITASSEITTIMAWLGTFAFGLQIYFDFSAYSDMAIGMGKMLGFSFLENFNYPYIANSVTNFWQRWHMSLSTFFRDYVYIPLGGNRCSKIKHIRNIFVVWGLTGMWHGASWNFIIWGLYFGVLLVIEKFFLKKYLEKIPNVLRIIYTDFLVLISWAIFSFDNFSDLKNWFAKMFGIGTKVSSEQTLYYLKNYAIILVICIIGCTPLFKNLIVKLEQKLKKNKILLTTFDIVCLIVCILILLLSIAYLVNASYNPFLYFRF
ncbi:MAG: MBOAT family protein [Clostridia bacterium]|nr:MBOAT family protein [Clostridia bacterium]